MIPLHSKPEHCLATVEDVRYCNRCMKVLPIACFMKGTLQRKSCGNCRERNRLRFAQHKAERNVAQYSVPVTLEGIAGFISASIADARRAQSIDLASASARRRANSPSAAGGMQLLFKVIFPVGSPLRRSAPRLIADMIALRVGEGDGYVWQPGASYVNADCAIAQTFHYRCSLRTDPAKRRGGATAQQTPWRYLDCYNCGGLVKVAIAADSSYAVVTIEHRTLHRRPVEITATPMMLATATDPARYTASASPGADDTTDQMMPTTSAATSAAALLALSNGIAWPRPIADKDARSISPNFMTPQPSPRSADMPTDASQLLLRQWIATSGAETAGATTPGHYTPPFEMPLALSTPMVTAAAMAATIATSAGLTIPITPVTPSFPFPMVAPPAVANPGTTNETIRLLRQLASLAEDQRAAFNNYSNSSNGCLNIPHANPYYTNHFC